MNKQYKIALVEPFYGGSHKYWADNYISNSRHKIMLFSLPDRFWKWRMHGAAISIFKQLEKVDFDPDAFLVSDMIDLPLFRSLLHQNGYAAKPVFLYFHENQLSYPWAKKEQKGENYDQHYGFMNYTSALVADAVFFNSHYHKKEFFDYLNNYLDRFPDEKLTKTIDQIIKKSAVAYPGVVMPENRLFLDHKKQGTILWNHRWEHDKNAEDFFSILTSLKEEGYSFKLIVAGENYSHSPNIFKSLNSKFEDELIHLGYAEQREDYIRLLSNSTILPVTNNQEFFGISVLEAISYGAVPLLPDRLSYPELIPKKYHYKYLYGSLDELKRKLKGLIVEPYIFPYELINELTCFDVTVCVNALDEKITNWFKIN